MRTRIDIASCAAGPRSPFSIARSDSVSARDMVISLTIIRAMRKPCAAIVLALFVSALPAAQAPRPRDESGAIVVLKPARVFDGDTMHEGWAVRVKGEKIEAVGPAASVSAPGNSDARVIDLAGTTLTPGLMEGHSHVLLHAYDEASWTDQVSREGLALRVARAVNHLRSTLLAGFTTIRDLGTEGAQYADVELKQ